MTKMTLPVSFNEPTSLLQRVTEDMVRHSLYTHMIAAMWAARRCIGSRLRAPPLLHIDCEADHRLVNGYADI